jgi:hypothetical protein
VDQALWSTTAVLGRVRVRLLAAARATANPGFTYPPTNILETPCLLREGPCSQGASQGGSAVPEYRHKNF